MRFVVSFLLLFSLSLLEAQQLVSSNDGTLHFFSTLVPNGSNLPASPRLYRYSPAGLVVEDAPQFDPLLDNVGTLDASADGTVVAYWSLHHPLSPNPFCGGICYYPITYTGKVMTGGSVQTFGRPVSLSSNGRFAVLSDSTAPPERLDLRTGDRISAPTGLLSSPRQAITADGSLLLSVRNGSSVRLFLWSPSEQRDVATIQAGNSSLAAVISSNGRHVVWASYADYTVHAIDLSSGTDAVIATGSAGATQLSIDDEGDLVTFTAGAPLQLYVARTDGSSTQVFDGAPEGVSQATLQHDGTSAYALTASNRLLRIDTTSMEGTDLWSPPPLASVLAAQQIRLAPGSFQRITGSNLNSNVSIGGVQLQVLYATPQEIHVQVPFDAPGTTGFLHFKSDSPLEQSFPAEIRNLSPRFLTYWDAGITTTGLYYPVIVHGDYSGFVTQQNPAHLGETVHIYMSGLGPVTPSVSTGALSPSDPPAMLTGGIHVSALGQDIPIVFAGLAPQLTGVYLLSIRLAESLEPSLRQQVTQPVIPMFITVREDGAADGVTASVPIELP